MIHFELNDPIIGKHYKITQKRLKLGMVSSFDPHSMCAKVERITAKTGCTSCTNWTISFNVRGFQTKTHLFQRHFIFLCVEQNTRFPLYTARRWLMSASISMHRRTYAGNPNDLYSVDELKYFYICVAQNTRFPLHTARRWLMSASISMHCRTYAGNPNDLYSVDELKAFYIR